MTVAKAEQLDDKAARYRARYGLTFNQWKHLTKDLGLTTEQIRGRYERWQRRTQSALEAECVSPDYTFNGESFLSAKQVSRALGIGEFHVVNLNHRGKLKGVKGGRYVMYRCRDVADLLERDWSAEESKRSPLAQSFLSATG